MAVKGIKEVRQKLKKITEEIGGSKAERAVAEVLIVGGGGALVRAPIAIGNLINSLFREVKKTGDHVTGRLGFGAEYAVFVHEAKGVLMGTNTPRWPKSDGVVWGPDAEPEFLTKGFEEHLSDIERVIKRTMKI